MHIWVYEKPSINLIVAQADVTRPYHVDTIYTVCTIPYIMSAIKLESNT